MTKLLHCSAILSTSSGASIWYSWSLSSSFLNSFWSAYVTSLGGAWYGLTSLLTCKEEVPLKHPIPVNTSLNSCIFNIVSAHGALICFHFWTHRKLVYFMFSSVVSMHIIFSAIVWICLVLFTYQFVFFYIDHLITGSLCSPAGVMLAHFLVLQRNYIDTWQLYWLLWFSYTYLGCAWIVIGKQHYSLLIDLFNSCIFVCGKRILYILMAIKLPLLHVSNLYSHLSMFGFLFCFKLCHYYWSDSMEIENRWSYSIKFLSFHLFVLIIFVYVMNCSAAFVIFWHLSALGCAYLLKLAQFSEPSIALAISMLEISVACVCPHSICN